MSTSKSRLIVCGWRLRDLLDECIRTLLARANENVVILLSPFRLLRDERSDRTQEYGLRHSPHRHDICALGVTILEASLTFDHAVQQLPDGHGFPDPHGVFGQADQVVERFRGFLDACGFVECAKGLFSSDSGQVSRRQLREDCGRLLLQSLRHRFGRGLPLGVVHDRRRIRCRWRTCFRLLRQRGRLELNVLRLQSQQLLRGVRTAIAGRWGRGDDASEAEDVGRTRCRPDSNAEDGMRGHLRSNVAHTGEGCGNIVPVGVQSEVPLRERDIAIPGQRDQCAQRYLLLVHVSHFVHQERHESSEVASEGS